MEDGRNAGEEAQAGGDRREAKAGQIVFGPANVPHKFHNLGPGRLDTTDIHVSDRWIQTDLDDPEASP